MVPSGGGSCRGVAQWEGGDGWKNGLCVCEVVRQFCECMCVCVCECVCVCVCKVVRQFWVCV